MDRRERLALAVVLGLALVLRLGYVLGQRSDVLFDHPSLDEQRYVDEARTLAGGGAGEDRPYWQPPGITYALAATFRVAGPGLLLPRLIQVLLSTASCLLLFAIGRRLLSVRAGLIAAAILAVHGVLVFETAELLPPTWLVFLDLLAVWLLLRAGEPGGRRHRAPLLALAAGLTLGVSAVFAPTILPFAAIAALWLRRPLPIAALVAGVILPIAPVTLRNYRHGGELVLVSSNAGMNFYIGNNPDYDDTFALRPGRHWIELDDQPRQHGADTPGAASRYFLGRGLAFYAEQPGPALALLAHKALLFFHGAEIPRDTDIYAARRDSHLLAALVWPPPLRFPDGVLIPVALVGLALCWRQRRRLALPLGLLAVHAVVVPAFFVSARHRAPVLPLWALLAAAGGAAALARWRAGERRRLLGALGAVIGLAVVLGLPVREDRLSLAAERDFYRGLAHREQGRGDAAIAALRRATTADPGDARFWFELGETEAAMGRDREAAGAFRRAALADPWDSRASRRAAGALSRVGDLDGATAVLAAHIAAAARTADHYAPDLLNLAFLHASRGLTGPALDDLRAAIRADPDHCRRELPRMLAAARGNPAIRDPEFWAEAERLASSL